VLFSFGSINIFYYNFYKFKESFIIFNIIFEEKRKIQLIFLVFISCKIIVLYYNERVFFKIIYILGAVATYSTGRINGSWDKYGEYLIAIVSMGLGCILIVLSSNKSLNWSYGYYIIFCCTYQTMLTISR
jgi:hypothetical protein